MIEQESKDLAKAIEQLLKSDKKGQMTNPDDQLDEFRAAMATLHKKIRCLSESIIVQ